MAINLWHLACLLVCRLNWFVYLHQHTQNLALVCLPDGNLKLNLGTGSVAHGTDAAAALKYTYTLPDRIQGEQLLN